MNPLLYLSNSDNSYSLSSHSSPCLCTRTVLCDNTQCGSENIVLQLAMQPVASACGFWPRRENCKHLRAPPSVEAFGNGITP